MFRPVQLFSLVTIALTTSSKFTDVDECDSASASCHPNAQCTNIIGSYRCSCNNGFTGDGKTCTAIKCSSIPCHSKAFCEDTDISHKCTCASGYTGDGKKCFDIDECQDANICRIGQQCVNSDGSYKCVTGASYYVEFVFEGIYTLFLEDRYSQAFIELEEELHGACDEAYSGDPYYLGIIVHGFSAGSIKANITVLFKEPMSAPLLKIEVAVANGTFGNLNVSRISLISSDEGQGAFVSKDDADLVKKLVISTTAILAFTFFIAFCLLIISFCVKTKPVKVVQAHDLSSSVTTVPYYDNPEVMKFYYSMEDLSMAGIHN